MNDPILFSDILLSLNSHTIIEIEMTQYCHRTAVWLNLGDLWSPPSQNPLLRQEPPRYDCPGPCPGGFWRSARAETAQPAGQSVQVLGHAQSTKVFPNVQWEHQRCICNLCPLSVVLSLGSTEKSLALSSASSYQVSYA